MDLQGTKIEILRLLKRGGPASVDDLAAQLALAGMTIRQHLIALERDGLVEVCDRRRGPGRPSHLYHLSPDGDAMFPRGYDALARGLLEEIALLQPRDVAEARPHEKVAMVMARYAERLATPHRAELEGCDFETRALRAAAILGRMSGFVDTERRPDGIAIRDFNCAYRKIADLGPQPQLCAWHARFLSVLLGCEVCWQADSRDDCCSVFVPVPAVMGAAVPGEPVAARDREESGISWQEPLRA